MKKIIILMLIILPYQVFAQIDIELSNQSGITNFNMDGYTPVNTTMGINSANLNFTADNNFSYFGGLGLVQYYNFSERNYFNGYLGTGYSKYLNEEENSSINIYANGIFRRSINIDDLSDSYGLNTGIQYINQLAETSFLYAGTDFKYKSFNLANQLNYIENILSCSFNQSFETKTSIRLITNLNSKLYNSIYNESGDIIITQNGKSKSGLNSIASQFNYEIGIAQNLLEKTGIQGSLSGTVMLTNYNTQLDYIGFDFAGDSDFFDDPYSFDNITLKLTLTQILPFETRLSLSGAYSTKDYNYDVLIDEINYSQRIDNQTNYKLSLSKVFSFDSGLLSSLGVNIDYEYYSNLSNYGFMNFNGNFILIGLDIGF